MLSLGCELRVGVKLKVPASLTAKGSNGNTLITGCFRVPPKRLLGLAPIPALDKYTSISAIRHKPLDHVSFALLALHL